MVIATEFQVRLNEFRSNKQRICLAFGMDVMLCSMRLVVVLLCVFVLVRVRLWEWMKFCINVIIMMNAIPRNVNEGFPCIMA